MKTNPDLEIIKGGKAEDEPTPIEDNNKQNVGGAPSTDNINEEELEKFYEENKDALDMVGGLEMLENLLELLNHHYNKCLA